MAPQQEPTNLDIYRKLGTIEAIQQETLEQAKRTNGRVNELERWRTGIESVEKYKDKHTPQTVAEQKDGLSAREKALVGIIMGLLAIVTTLVGTGTIKP